MKRLLTTLILLATLPAFAASFPMTLYPLATGLTNVNIFLGAQGGLTRLIPFSLVQSNVVAGPSGAIQYKNPTTGIMGGDAGFLYSPTLFQANVSNTASGAFSQYGAGNLVIQTNDPVVSLRGTVTGDVKTIGSIDMNSPNDAATMLKMLQILGTKWQDAAGAEESYMEMKVMENGSLTSKLLVGPVGIVAYDPLTIPANAYGTSWSNSVLAATEGALYTKLSGGAISNMVYINIRADGATGSGTDIDPFDGSTQAIFDGIVTNRLNGYWLKLGPGTFQTKAAANNARFLNFRMTGAGEFITTIKGIPNSITNNQTFAIDGQSTGNTNQWQEVTDLTIDCNFAAITNGYMAGASLHADNVIFERVNVINSGVTNVATENVSLVIAGSTNFVARGNRFVNSAGRWDAIMIATSVPITKGSKNGVVENNNIMGAVGVGSGTQIGIGLTGTIENVVLNHNFIENVDWGIGADVGALTNIVAVANTIKLPIASSFGVGAYFNAEAGPSLVTDGVTLTGNTFLISSNSLGIDFRDAASTGLAHRNVTAAFNTVRIRSGGLTADTYGVAIVNATGVTLLHNRFDSTLATDVTTAGSTNIVKLGNRLLTGADATGALDTFNSITLGIDRLYSLTNGANITFSTNGNRLMITGAAGGSAPNWTVVGPGAAVADTAIMLWSGTTGTNTAASVAKISSVGAITGVSSLSVTSSVTLLTDDAYAAGWDNSLAVPTKNALYDKIQTLGGTGQGLSTNWVNGVAVIGANFTNTATVTYTVSGSNILASAAAGTGATLGGTNVWTGTNTFAELIASIGRFTSLYFADATGTNSITINGAGTNVSFSVAARMPSIVLSNLTASRVLVSDAQTPPGVVSSAVTSTVLGYLDIGGSLTTLLSGKQAGITVGDGLATNGAIFYVTNHAGELISSGTVADARIASALARDTEVTNVVLGAGLDGSLAGQLRTIWVTNHAGELISSGTVADARIATSLARLASPTLTGDPKSATPAENDNDTSIATTAYVQTEIAGLGGVGAALNGTNLWTGTNSFTNVTLVSTLGTIGLGDATTNINVLTSMNGPGFLGSNGVISLGSVKTTKGLKEVETTVTTGDAAVTNYYPNFDRPSVINGTLTNNVYFPYSTNAPGAGTVAYASFTFLSTADRTMGFAASFRRLGTNIVTIPSNKWVTVAFTAHGTTVTNVGTGKEE